MTIKTPYVFQEEAIEYGLTRNAYISLSCGLGKTITAIEIYKRMCAGGLTQPCLVVVSPKLAIYQWEQEIHAQHPEAEVVVLDYLDAKPYAFGRTHGKPYYFVTYYEFVTANVDWLKNMLWGIIVADEAHKINNRNAKRADAIKELETLRKVAMTGTPMQASPADLWSVLNWLYPTQFTSFWTWVEKYVAVMPGKNDVKNFVGTKKGTIAKLGAELRPIMIRRTKKQVAKELPPQIESVVPIMMYPDQIDLYNRIKYADDILVDLGDGTDIVIAQAAQTLLRLQQVGSDPRLLGVQLPSAKLDWVYEYVENNPNEQMLIFSRFRNIALAMAERLKSAMIVGGGRVSGVKEFRKGDIKVLCGTIAAMGTALDFPMASTMIFVDTEHSSIQMSQAIDRIHRLGITESKHLIYLEAIGGVDRLIRDAVKYKWSQTQLVYNFVEQQFPIDKERN